MREPTTPQRDNNKENTEPGVPSKPNPAPRFWDTQNRVARRLIGAIEAQEKADQLNAQITALAADLEFRFKLDK
jgi:hypothetical protein